MFEIITDICRLCLESGVLIPIFHSKPPLSFKIMFCTSVQMYEHDGLPDLICRTCLSQLESAFSFRQKVEQSDKQLRKLLNIHSHKNNTIQKEPEIFHSLDHLKILHKQSNEIKHDNEIINLHRKVSEGVECNNIKSHLSFAQESSIKTENNIPAVELNIIEVPNVKNNSTLDENITKGKRIRDGSKKHMCDTCGKTFLYLSNLADHSRIHTGDKPFICAVCGHRFSQTGHLMIHARTHTGVKPYKCNVCSRAFTVSHALKKHLRTHTGERPYPCGVCNKTFVTSYHLANHFKRHTGEKNFKCDWPDCSLSFVNVSEMKRHRVRHEKNSEWNTTKNANLTQDCDVPLVSNEYLNERSSC